MKRRSIVPIINLNMSRIIFRIPNIKKWVVSLVSPIRNSCSQEGIFRKRKCIHNKIALICLRSNSTIQLFSLIKGQRDKESKQKLGQLDKKKMLVRFKSINLIEGIKHSKELWMREKVKMKQAQLKSIDFYFLTNSLRSNKRSKRRMSKKAIKSIADKNKIPFIWKLKNTLSNKKEMIMN